MKAKRALYTDFIRRESASDRAWYDGGTHLSAILNFILRTFDPDTYGKPVDEGTRRLWELGFAVEDAIGDAFARRLERPSSQVIQQCRLQLDGVRMSLDAFDLREWLVREYKYTRMSANKDIRDLKMRRYLWQVKAYCRAAETLKAKLIVVHGNGNYTQGSPVIPYQWSLRFSPHELDSNWRMILANKRRMEEAA